MSRHYTAITQTIVRTFQVPAYGESLDERELMKIVKDSGSHFFDDDNMRSFRSRLEDIVPGPDGWYFITSEKHVSHFSGINEPRKYTVRRLSVNADHTDLDLHELDALQYYPTLRRARTALKRCRVEGTIICEDCRCRVTFAEDTYCAECIERKARHSAEAQRHEVTA